MKAREQTESKGRIVRGSSHRTTVQTGETKDVKGMFAFLKKIIKKVECIGKQVERINNHLNTLPYNSDDDDEEARVPPVATTQATEEESDESSNEGDATDKEIVSDSGYTPLTLDSRRVAALRRFKDFQPKGTKPYLFSIPYQQAPLRTLLPQHWPSIRQGRSDVQFWDHEWYTHGHCSTLSPRRYFEETVRAKHRLNVLNWLQNYQIYPSRTRVWTLPSIETAIQIGAGVSNAYVSCRELNRTHVLLFEVVATVAFDMGLVKKDAEAERSTLTHAKGSSLRG
ncbi:hypothetical protein LguiA_019615 [Lonicera macranthoides]